MNIFENAKNRAILKDQKEEKSKARSSLGSPREDAVFQLLGDGGLVIDYTPSQTTVKTRYGSIIKI